MPEDVGDAPGLWAVASTLSGLSLMSVRLRLMGFKRLYLVLEREAERIAARRSEGSSDRSASSDSDESGDSALKAARAYAATVTRVNRRYSPIEAGCLVESLALWWGLRKRCIEAELRLGVRTLVGPLQSHAWVEYRGVPLNDVEGVGQIFEPFDLSAISSDQRLP